MAEKSALIFLAEGAEEMETVIVADLLRRAKVNVTLASLNPDSATPVTCSRNIRISADCSVESIKGQTFDAVILPGGGKGAENLAASQDVKEILQSHDKQGKILAAVCAAPTAFLSHDIGKGKKVTSYPAFKAKLENDYVYSEDRVIVDGNIVTSRGPGTSFEFGFKLAELLVDKAMAEQLKSQTLCL